MTMSISAQIRAAMAVIADKDHWCVGSYGRRRNPESIYGEETFRDAEDLQTLAVQFCAVGAFAKVLGIDGDAAHQSAPVKWIAAWGDRFPDSGRYGFSLAKYNNDNSHRDVMALLERAATAREAQEAAAAATN